MGFSILWFGVNGYAFLFAMIGFIVYVGFYSLWTKRTSIHQTVIGSISGASPPVIGYTAVTHQFDVAALLFFSIRFMANASLLGNCNLSF